MPDFLIEDLEPGLVERLKIKAALHGRSLEEEVREILTSAVPPPNSALKGRHLNSLGFQPQVGEAPKK
jgi:plasmid stability protein